MIIIKNRQCCVNHEGLDTCFTLNCNAIVTPDLSTYLILSFNFDKIIDRPIDLLR